jgi:hypothetical protein
LWWGRPSSANHCASGNFFYTLRALFHLRFKRSTTNLDPRQQTSLVSAVCQPPWEFPPFSVELRTDPEKDVPKPLQASDSGTRLGRVIHGFWLWVRVIVTCQRLPKTNLYEPPPYPNNSVCPPSERSQSALLPVGQITPSPLKPTRYPPSADVSR